VSVAGQSFSNQQENFTNDIDEHFGIEKNLNHLCIEDDDDSSEIRPRRSKRQCTVPLSTTVDQNTYDYDNDDEDLSMSHKLHSSILANKDDHNSSDEESLGDDDTPLGWKNILYGVDISEDE
jgi:hypothetical protein